MTPARATKGSRLIGAARPPLGTPRAPFSAARRAQTAGWMQNAVIRGPVTAFCIQTAVRGSNLPDQAYYRPEHQSDRGAERAELVVEIRSNDDETYDKIGFYAQVGVREMLIVHLEGRWIELLRAVGSRLLPVSADAHGVLRSEVLGAQFATVDGRLRITWQDGTADI